MIRTLLLLLISIAAIFQNQAQDFSALQYREAGPFRGGRVTTVAGVASQPSVFYLGSTGGGLWKTKDYGTTWKNVSDGYFSTPSIGAIAVAQNDPNIIYAGTGTDGLRSNVIEGRGVYKSIDAGATWTFIGLKDVGQIGAVRIHPTNHNVVYVAAIGNAFKGNTARGVFKTTNGGESWEKVLYLSDKVGFSDIEMMPTNPEILYATAWKAERKPWTIISGGTGAEGGIYKSVDGGKNWRKSSKGLPIDLIGKIDVAVTPADSRIVYALVEAPDDLGGLYKSTDLGESYTLISNEKGLRTRPFYYTNVRVDPKNSDVVYVLATRYYKSVNGGKDWNQVIPPHGDNHDMWINPDNPDLFIQANDGGANVTHNGGDSWSTQFNQPTSEIYQVEVDDQYPYWMYGGQQDNWTTVSVPSFAPFANQAGGTGYIMSTGGCETGPAVPKPGDPNIVYANCKGRFTVFNKSTGTEQSYYVGAGNMYGHNPANLTYRFQRVSPIHVSPHDPNIVYHTSQFVHKTLDEGKTWETISPDLTAFEADKQVISGSPITRDITGEEFYSTIYSIRESPVNPGLIWVGSNDGPIHVTRDGGKNWKNVTPAKMPKGGRVDAVEPSPHDPAKAYASILRYQLGDRKPYIYKTENFGESWELITNGIPSDFPTRVIREDPEKEGLLYAGTELGLFVSFNDGKQWTSFQQNLPVTPITDLKIHRDDLVLSTMGRGFWVLDNISTMRQSDFKDLTTPTLFSTKKAIRYRFPSRAHTSTRPTYPKPSAIIDYFLPVETQSAIKLEVVEGGNNVIATFVSDTSNRSKEDQVLVDMSTNQVDYLIDADLTANQGLNRFQWDMTEFGPWNKETNRSLKNGPMVMPGIYTLRLTVDGTSYEQSLEVMVDPRVLESGVSLADIEKQVTLQRSIRELLSESRKLEVAIANEITQMEENRAPASDLDAKRASLSKLMTKVGTYEQPMISDQLAYLYRMLNNADQIPGKDAYDRFDYLKSELEKVNVQ